jgi:ABC-type phosphate/phosphonate transport system substrate-binding protein
MYSVSPEAAHLWRRLLTGIAAAAGESMDVIAHSEPEPLEDLWRRPDQGAVFMCGLPLSRAEPQPALVAAPVPAPPAFDGRAAYWSDFVVRADRPWRRIEDTFDSRLALTLPGSQSGCMAALSHFMETQASAGASHSRPLYREIIAPTVTPLGALTAVIEDAADVAPIDSYALALLRQHRPDLASRVRSVGRTVSTPIPPLVSSAPPAPALAAAFLEAHRNSALKELMDALLLRRFVRPEPAAYQALAKSAAAAEHFWSSRPLAAHVHPVFVTNRP